MNSTIGYIIMYISAFLAYYLFRYFFDDSLPLLPINRGYKNAVDVIEAIETLIVMAIGLGFGYLIILVIEFIGF